MDSAEADFRPLPPQDYPKLSQSYYSLLEVLTQDHMNFIASLEPHVIMYILSSISEGLTALGKHLGLLVGFYHVTKQKGRLLAQYLKGYCFEELVLPTECIIMGTCSSSKY